MDTLTVSLPRDFATWLGSPTQANATAQEYIVVGLFQEGRISAGKAAEMLGLTRHGLLNLLARKGIDYFRLDLAEWNEEVEAIRRRDQNPK